VFCTLFNLFEWPAPWSSSITQVPELPRKPRSLVASRRSVARASTVPPRSVRASTAPPVGRPAPVVIKQAPTVTKVAREAHLKKPVLLCLSSPNSISSNSVNISASKPVVRSFGLHKARAGSVPPLEIGSSLTLPPRPKKMMVPRVSVSSNQIKAHRPPVYESDVLRRARARSVEPSINRSSPYYYDDLVHSLKGPALNLRKKNISTKTSPKNPINHRARSASCSRVPYKPSLDYPKIPDVEVAKRHLKRSSVVEVPKYYYVPPPPAKSQGPSIKSKVIYAKHLL
jgi:hypothetical protein